MTTYAVKTTTTTCSSSSTKFHFPTTTRNKEDIHNSCHPQKSHVSSTRPSNSTIYDATARLLSSKVVDSIWNKTIIRIDADDVNFVNNDEIDDNFTKQLKRKKITKKLENDDDEEIIQIDLLLDRNSLNVLKFKQLGKIYLEFDAVIQNMAIVSSFPSFV
jgi:hypothetical protein